MQRLLALIFLFTALAACSAPMPASTGVNFSTLPPPVVRVTTTTPPPTRSIPSAMPPSPPPSRIPPTGTSMPPVLTESFTVYSNYFGYNHVVTVYLPGEYTNLPDKRYKVLYVNDGQELSQVGFEIYLDSLYAARQVESLIVVAVQSNDNRLFEYGMGATPNVYGWGTLGQEYANFIIRELKPEINKRYRTLTGAQNTGFMGWSLGGSTAFYIVWQYPNEFGIIGGFSPSFWWRTSENTFDEVLNTRTALKIVRESAKRPGMRFWFEAGTVEETNDRDKNGVIDVIQDLTDLMDELAKKGYKSEIDMKLLVVPGGKHELSTWVTVMPEFLRWAFPYKK